MNYSIAAAIRGPDNCDRYVTGFKELLTARIRATQWDRTECFGSWKAEPWMPEDMEHLQRLLTHFAEIPPPLSHYLEHTAAAINLLREHPIWGGYSSEIVYLLEQACATING